MFTPPPLLGQIVSQYGYLIVIHRAHVGFEAKNNKQCAERRV